MRAQMQHLCTTQLKRYRNLKGVVIFFYSSIGLVGHNIYIIEMGPNFEPKKTQNVNFEWFLGPNDPPIFPLYIMSNRTCVTIKKL